MKKKLLDNQVSLLGDIYRASIKYIPHVQWHKTEAVVIVRIPPGALEIDRQISYNEMRRLAKEIKTSGKRRKKH